MVCVIDGRRIAISGVVTCGVCLLAHSALPLAYVGVRALLRPRSLAGQIALTCAMILGAMWLLHPHVAMAAGKQHLHKGAHEAAKSLARHIKPEDEASAVQSIVRDSTSLLHRHELLGPDQYRGLLQHARSKTELKAIIAHLYRHLPGHSIETQYRYTDLLHDTRRIVDELQPAPSVTDMGIAQQTAREIAGIGQEASRVISQIARIFGRGPRLSPMLTPLPVTPPTVPMEPIPVPVVP